MRGPYKIAIADEQQHLHLDHKFLKRVTECVLKEEGVVRAELSFAFVDNAGIHTVNRDFLGHDYTTDVVSFLLDSETPAVTPGKRRAKLAVPRGAGKSLDGEIIISAEMAVERAAEFRWNAHDEFVLYLVHGVLHLCGYDDLSDAEQKIMRGQEVAMLALFDLVPRYVAKRAKT